MTSALVQKLTGVRDLKKILETTVKELGETFSADTCQIILSNPLDPNVTAICEYRASQEDSAQLPGTMFPLTLQGKALGQLSLSRMQAVSPDEVNAIRVILAELGDIIRHAQINDIVQRDTFRETFLVEIGNVMAYSLGIGDALFMVVNILGKVLQSSRCIFICTDDTQAGWKCYEFWQQDKVQSCQEYRWPTTDSPIVAQALLARSPLIVHEGQQNSYVTPVQEELQFLGVKSLLGIPLRTDASTHGCVILQQCDQRRAWTRGEVDMAQNVADKVADALAKLPAEKRAREPIMQLHQRTVAVPEDGAKPTIQSVRTALKGALGQQAIPVAQKTSAPPAPKPAAPPPPPPPAPAAAAPPTVPSDSFAPPPAPVPSGGKSLNSILGGIKAGAASSTMAALDFGAPGQPDMPPSPAAAPAAAAWGAPEPAGAWGTPEPAGAWGTPEPAAAPAEAFSGVESAWGAPAEQAMPSPQVQVAVDQAAVQGGAQWGNLGAIPSPGTGAASGQWGNLDAIGSPGAGADQSAGQWGNLDAIPAPGAAPSDGGGHWGNLDSIPTPSAGPAKGGLGGVINVKGKGPQPTSPLLASLHKDKTKFEPPKTEYIEGPPVEIDEAAAQAKLQQILSSSNPTSDFIFATPGVDTRMLGRIDGWVSQIEAKDKYANGHARQVTEYAMAIAKQAGLSAQDIALIRLAAIVHDVGKLGTAAQILQKKDEDLTDAELLLMMKHPLDGAELLDSFPDLKQVAEIVRAHHEEYDGNGYPAGLKGEAIPLAARIICVANSYHSLTSPMKYGPGMSPTEAQQVLTKGAGRQWDPRFVEALILSIMQQHVPAVFN